MPRDARAQDVAASRCETGILKPTNRDASRHTAHRPRAAFASPAAVMATTTTTTTTTTRIDRVAASSSRATVSDDAPRACHLLAQLVDRGLVAAAAHAVDFLGC